MSILTERARRRHEQQMKKEGQTPQAEADVSGSTPIPAGAAITDKVQRGGAAGAAAATIAAIPIRETIPVKLADLHIRPGYERHPSEFAGAEWEDFVASIASSKGNIQPIDVRLVRGGKTPYQIIAGERRFRAHLQLGLATILCAVRDLDEERADFIHDTENAKRADKSPFSLAMQLSVMMRSGRYESQADMAGRLGRNRGDISRLLSLYDKAPANLWERIKDPTNLTHREATAIIQAYDKPAFVEWVKHLDRSAVTPVETLVKKAKEVCARPKPQKTVIEKIREVERGDAFHIVLPKAIPAKVRKEVLEFAKKRAAEAEV